MVPQKMLTTSPRPRWDICAVTKNQDPRSTGSSGKIKFHHSKIRGVTRQNYELRIKDTQDHVTNQGVKIQDLQDPRVKILKISDPQGLAVE